jgi:hypothetical protein
MSVLAQKQTFAEVCAMSALLPKADISLFDHPVAGNALNVTRCVAASVEADG